MQNCFKQRTLNDFNCFKPQVCQQSSEIINRMDFARMSLIDICCKKQKMTLFSRNFRVHLIINDFHQILLATKHYSSPNPQSAVSSSLAIFANECKLQVLWVPRQVAQIYVALKLVQFFTTFNVMQFNQAVFIS